MRQPKRLKDLILARWYTLNLSSEEWRWVACKMLVPRGKCIVLQTPAHTISARDCGNKPMYIENVIPYFRATHLIIGIAMHILQRINRSEIANYPNGLVSALLFAARCRKLPQFHLLKIFFKTTYRYSLWWLPWLHCMVHWVAFGASENPKQRNLIITGLTPFPLLIRAHLALQFLVSYFACDSNISCVLTCREPTGCPQSKSQHVLRTMRREEPTY